MKNIPKAMFVDLDDTLLVFNPAGEAAWKIIVSRFSEKTGLFSPESFFSLLERVRDEYWGTPERHQKGRLRLLDARREMVGLVIKELGIEDAGLSQQISDEYSSLQYELMKLSNGAIETLEKLLRYRVRLALITNGQTLLQRAKINRFHLKQYFEEILIEEEIGYGKPDERVYHLGLTRMNLQPSDVWMVGDNLEWDVYAPMRIGIVGVWNDYRKQGLPEGMLKPDKIIHSFAEILK